MSNYVNGFVDITSTSPRLRINCENLLRDFYLFYLSALLSRESVYVQLAHYQPGDCVMGQVCTRTNQNSHDLIRPSRTEITNITQYFNIVT